MARPRAATAAEVTAAREFLSNPAERDLPAPLRVFTPFAGCAPPELVPTWLASKRAVHVPFLIDTVFDTATATLFQLRRPPHSFSSPSPPPSPRTAQPAQPAQPIQKPRVWRAVTTSWLLVDQAKEGPPHPVTRLVAPRDAPAEKRSISVGAVLYAMAHDTGANHTLAAASPPALNTRAQRRRESLSATSPGAVAAQSPAPALAPSALASASAWPPRATDWFINSDGYSLLPSAESSASTLVATASRAQLASTEGMVLPPRIAAVQRLDSLQYKYDLLAARWPAVAHAILPLQPNLWTPAPSAPLLQGSRRNSQSKSNASPPVAVFPNANPCPSPSRGRGRGRGQSPSPSPGKSPGKTGKSPGKSPGTGSIAGQKRRRSSGASASSAASASAAASSKAASTASEAAARACALKQISELEWAPLGPLCPFIDRGAPLAGVAATRKRGVGACVTGPRIASMPSLAGVLVSSTGGWVRDDACAADGTKGKLLTQGVLSLKRFASGTVSETPVCLLRGAAFDIADLVGWSWSAPSHPDATDVVNRYVPVFLNATNTALAESCVPSADNPCTDSDRIAWLSLSRKMSLLKKGVSHGGTREDSASSRAAVAAATAAVKAALFAAAPPVLSPAPSPAPSRVRESARNRKGGRTLPQLKAQPKAQPKAQLKAQPPKAHAARPVGAKPQALRGAVQPASIKPATKALPPKALLKALPPKPSAGRPRQVPVEFTSPLIAALRPRSKH